MSCSLVAPAFPNSYNGAKPIFNWNENNANYLGFGCAFVSNNAPCTYVSGKSFVPVVTVAGAKTYTCSLSLGEKHEASILCPNLPVASLTSDCNIGYTSVHSEAPKPKPTAFHCETYPYVTVTDRTIKTVTSRSTSTFTGKTSTVATTTKTVPESSTTATITQVITHYASTTRTVSQCSSASNSPSKGPTNPASTSPSNSSSKPASTSPSETPSKTPSASLSEKSSPSSSRSSYAASSYSSSSAHSPSNSPSLSQLSQPYKSSSTERSQQPTVHSSSTVKQVSSTTSATQSSATPHPGSPQCPDDNGKHYYSKGQVFQIECYTDRYGGDLPSGSPVQATNLGQCVEACINNKKCVDVSLHGETCYLKGSIKKAKGNDRVLGAVKVGSYDATQTVTTPLPATATNLPAPEPTETRVQYCPSQNGTTFTGSCGSKWIVECGLDRDDSNISDHEASSLDECANICDATPSCVDVSWVAGSLGTCYLKSATNLPKYRDDVWGARQLSGCTTTASSSGPKTTAAPKFKRFVQDDRKMILKPRAPAPGDVRFGYAVPDRTWGLMDRPMPTTKMVSVTVYVVQWNIFYETYTPTTTATTTITSGTSTAYKTTQGYKTLTSTILKTVTACSVTSQGPY